MVDTPPPPRKGPVRYPHPPLDIRPGDPPLVTSGDLFKLVHLGLDKRVPESCLARPSFLVQFCVPL